MVALLGSCPSLACHQVGQVRLCCQEVAARVQQPAHLLVLALRWWLGGRWRNHARHRGLLVRLLGRGWRGRPNRGLALPAELLQRAAKLRWGGLALGRQELHRGAAEAAGQEGLAEPLILLAQLVNVASLHDEHCGAIQRRGCGVHGLALHEVVGAQEAVGADDAPRRLLLRVGRLAPDDLHLAEYDKVDGAEGVHVIEEDVPGLELGLPHEAHQPRHRAWRAPAEDFCLAQTVDCSHRHEVLEAPV
mmetsp:Transcript_27262/g.78569  ORF Transcript_27262/g.78569 Transcript_27262/m.78569 type:complete len:247 (+) Transcript_27262:632-1372(+)